MKIVLLSFVILLLAACDAMHDTTVRGLDEVQTNTSNGIDKVRNLLDVGHPATVNLTPQDRYCYKTYQDVECYNTPQPNKGLEMTGFQIKGGKAGYVPEEIPVPLAPLKQVSVPVASAVKGNAAPSADVSPPPASNMAQNTSPAAAKKSNPQGLHEVIFDAEELNPKDLVATKPQ